MTPNENDELGIGDTDAVDNVQSKLDNIDESFLDQLEEDGRLDSGVPGGVSGSDIDFIQMTGLTKPAISESGTQASRGDLDPTKPISFFEKGVADVDSELSPAGSLEHSDSENQDIVAPADAAPQSPIADLKEIIADLTAADDSLDSSADVAPLPFAGTGAEQIEAIDQDVYPPADEVEDIEFAEEPDASAESDDSFLDAPEEAEAAEAADMVSSISEEPELVEAIQYGDPEIAEILEPEVESVEIETSDEASDAADELQQAPLVEPLLASDEAELPVAEQPVSEEVFGLSLGDELADALSLENDAAALGEERTPEDLPASKLPNLEEASQLLEELEKQPKELAAEFPVTEAADAKGEPIPKSAKPKEQSSKVLGMSRPSKRRSMNRRRRRRLKTARLLAIIVVLLASVVGGYFGYKWLEPRYIEPPQKTFNQASVLLKAGKYRDAHRAYELYLERLDTSGSPVSDSLISDGQFGSAFAMHMAATKSDSVPDYEESLALFKTFLSDNPADSKVARATALVGIINFNLGRYEDALEILGDPDIRGADMVSVLPVLRTMAKAYERLERYDEAQAEYIKAATLLDNYSSDEDYEALGDMYVRRAQGAFSVEERVRLEKLAIGHYSDASSVQGLSPTRKGVLAEKHKELVDKYADSSDEEK